MDLAGSERVGKTGVGGQILTEAKYINLSLHYLEQVGGLSLLQIFFKVHCFMLCIQLFCDEFNGLRLTHSCL